ncbi:MAG: EFR1 family ferrodoxin [Muribaculaceae bacterium]|nr:EFR1 family ferrodoxin [Muribaculaceae bacterium]
MIIFFSGTGNSRHVAQALGKELGESNIVELTGDFLRYPEQLRLESEEGGRVIWVFPTYSWGVPPVVAEVISKVNIDGGERADHYMVTTCGDDIGKCHMQWRNLISGRRWKPLATFSVQMPNTYVCMKGFDVDPEQVAMEKIHESVMRVHSIAEFIKQRYKIDDVVEGRWPKIKTRYIYPYFKKHYMNPSGFHVSETTCISCGKCSRNCPMDNIELKGKFPVWGAVCAFCLRCYHGCPVHAIEYGNSTVGKGQYMFPKKEK